MVVLFGVFLLTLLVITAVAIIRTPDLFVAVMLSGIFSLLMAAAFFNNAALRDHNNEFNEILFTTPLSKPGYYFGRFFGALFISTLPLIGVFIGMLLGTYLNSIFEWIAPERFGPFYLETFVNNYVLFILPNMFLAGTIIFAMANKWKSTVISFVGALVVGFLVGTRVGACVGATDFNISVTRCSVPVLGL